MKELHTIVSENIIALRKLHKMTQLELGEKLNYSDKAISKWERGEAIPDAVILKQMSELFGVTVDYLLSDHTAEGPTSVPRRHKNGLPITMITVVGIWAVAILVFVIFWICGRLEWLVFAYTLPVSLIALLVHNSIWRRGRRNSLIISALIWSILAAVYFAFFSFNWWQIFILGIPAEIIVYFSRKIELPHK